MSTKSTTLSKEKKKLWKIFSKYVRNRDKGICITCGIQKPVKEMQAGHYIPRTHNSTFIDERNVNCQCYGCNVGKKGAIDEYAIKLRQMYGEDVLEELHQLKWTTRKFTIQELKDLQDHYNNKLKDYE